MANRLASLLVLSKNLRILYKILKQFDSVKPTFSLKNNGILYLLNISLKLDIFVLFLTKTA